MSASATKVTLASESGNPSEVKETGTAHAGDIVQTDSAGKAQLDYPDGSLTRLGPDSKFTIDELDSATAQRTAVTLDVGQSWHRVKKLVAEGAQYEVTTPVGTASVRGTAFAVVCEGNSSCAFTVIEGLVQVKTKDGTLIDVHPFEKVTVPENTAAVPYPMDAVQADEWIMNNLELDGIELADSAAAAGPDAEWKASLDGVWSMAITITSETAENRQGNVGTTVTRVWTVTTGQCTADSCAVSISSDSGNTLPAMLSAAGLTVNPSNGFAPCLDSVTGETLSDKGYTTEFEYVLAQDGTEQVDGVPTVTSYSGIFTSVWTLADPVACAGAPESATSVGSVALVRADG
ncbi:FecR family protein [Cryobacterium psychrophilum]|uniref:FecR family protein n=1 Tax=Cryobacterium psychrophilum TaxID=41988 RepID=UPI0014170126|nr:FecR family protein [Cryobacterium psychrophilum]